MDLHALWYVLAALMVVVGLAGILLPAIPGLPLVFAGTEVVEFSPTDQLRATMAVLGANMAAQEPVR